MTHRITWRLVAVEDLKFHPYVTSALHAGMVVRLKLRPLLFLPVGFVSRVRPIFYLLVLEKRKFLVYFPY